MAPSNETVAETPEEYSSSSAQKSFARRNAALRLQMVQGIGPRIYGDLIERFGSPEAVLNANPSDCLLYTSPSPRDKRQSRMPSSA